MKKFLVALVFSTTIFASCETTQVKQPDATNVLITRKDLNAEVIKTVANLSIEGMTCSAGCGGKIQQDLRALNGVAITTLDYADGRIENVVSVEFNPALLKEAELISCVHNISNGQYRVKSMEIVSYHGLQSTESGGSADVKVEDRLGQVFQLLNLLQSVARMIQG